MITMIRVICKHQKIPCDDTKSEIRLMLEKELKNTT